MQFLVIGHDGTDAAALGRRMAAREAHIRLGDQMRDKGELLYRGQDLSHASLAALASSGWSDSA